MPLTISLQFPTGRYVAAAWNDKHAPEWPPHPARLCLGLLDALHKSGNPALEREALLWLCRQGASELVIPTDSYAEEFVSKGVYVPQNLLIADKVTDKKKKNPTGIKHSRKERSFPGVLLDSDAPSIFLHWPEAGGMPSGLPCLLDRLPRWGHSSSLVIARIAEGLPETDDEQWIHLRPTDPNTPLTPSTRLRVPWDGIIESAEDAYDAAGRAKEMAGLVGRAEKSVKPAKNSTTPKPLKPAASPRARHDPRHRWCGYAQREPGAALSGPWDRHVLLLQQTDGDRLGVQSTWQITETLHRTLLDRWSRDPDRGPVPSWLSGHRPGGDGNPTSPADHLHLALFPLAFVDSAMPHASGRLLGLGMALPKAEELGIDPNDFRIAWRKAIAALLEEDGSLILTPPDRSWAMTLHPVSSPSPPKTLQPARWTRPSRRWASVTPIILDRHPKPHFKKDPARWESSCREILAKSCRRLGLPEPTHIQPSLYSTLHGAPPAPAFVAPRSRPGRPARFHVHAMMEFAEPVGGPLLIGAGRYRGYGLMMPLPENSDTTRA